MKERASNDDVEECRAAAAAYALGSLSAEEARQFELRLQSGCPFCTAELASFAEVASHLAMSVPQQPPSPLLRERVLSSIGTAQEQPAAATRTIMVRGNDSPWVRLPIPGVNIRPLLGEKTLLVRMEPGTVYPTHQHQQDEQCYVLEGSITDADGVIALAGDFICMPAGSTHRPIHTDTGCLLLIAYTS